MIYVGIDPGVTGSIAILEVGVDRPVLMAVFDTPSIQATTGKKNKQGKPGMKNVYNLPGMAELLRVYAEGPDLVQVVIEKAQPMPDQGAVSMFGYGVGWGMWLGILAALKLPYTMAHPATWKRALMFDSKKGKGHGVVRALQLYPEAERWLTLVRHHNRADAILLAHYAWYIAEGAGKG